MSVLSKLSALVLTQVLDRAGQAVGVGKVGRPVVAVLENHLTDHSRKLPAALRAATDRAWTALEVALAGDTFWQRCTAALAGAEDKAFRQQVRAYLDAAVLTGDANRREALAQLRSARKVGVLGGGIDPQAVAGRVADFARYADPTELLAAEWRAADGLGDDLRADYPALAEVVSARPADGMPVLVVAARYFFRRQVEADAGLFRGLTVAQLDRLSAAQEGGYAALDAALTGHGDRLQTLLADVQAVVVETRDAVLDLQVQVEGQSEQVRQVAQAVEKLLDQYQQLSRRELRPGDSQSVRNEHERELIKQVVARYRSLPEGDRRNVPALLSAVGKLEVVTGDFAAAQQDFEAVAEMERDDKAKAEAHHNAYTSALERRDWSGAVRELVKAVNLDPKRFAPFPTGKYQPVRILGAGGFGVAFLCKHKLMDARVVIKTLTLDDLGRDADKVFTEAQVLRQLDHPAVIRIADCGYVDAAKKSRPFLVMDYFEGGTLEERVEKGGPLAVPALVAVARQVAEGLHAAHQKGILHRDVKPANLLVNDDGGQWKAKVIDFGLAQRQKVAQKSGNASTATRSKTLVGGSIAGTLDYGPPEQMGKRTDPLGAYSDVYGWAKTCCYALFQTTQPKLRHWQSVPGPLADLLGRCLEEDPKARPADFAQVLAELDGVTDVKPPAKVVRPAVVEEFDELTASRSAPEGRRPERPVQPNRLPLLIGGAVVGVVMVAGLAVLASGLLMRSGSIPSPARVPGAEQSGSAAPGPKPAEPPVDQTPSVRAEARRAEVLEPAWTPLLNGRNLDGWTPIPFGKASADDARRSWTWDAASDAVVSDGSVHSELQTTLTYKDFGLRFQWRFKPGGPAGPNGSGVMVRCRGIDPVSNYDPRGVEIDFRPTADPAQQMGSGCFFVYGTTLTNHRGGTDGRKGRSLGWLQEPPQRASNEWNDCEITCQSDKISVSMNDVKVNEGWGAEDVGGRISLRSQKTAVEFRRVEVKELPRTSDALVNDDVLFQGEWVCTHEEFAGEAISAAELETMGKTLVVSGDRFVIERSKDVGRGKYEGKVKLTPTASPKEFDFYGDEPGGNKVWFYGVYELTADEFKICYFRATTPDDRSKRATDFKTRQGVPLVMNKFKRITSLRGETNPLPKIYDVLKGVDTTSASTKGVWKWDGNALLSPACREGESCNSWILLPRPPSDQYRLDVEIERLEDGQGVNIGLVVQGVRVMVIVDGFAKSGGASGLEMVDGKRGNANETSRTGKRLPVGERKLLSVEVSGTTIKAFCDDDQLFVWTGRPSQLSLSQQQWAVPEPGRLFLGTQAKFRFTKLTAAPLVDRQPEKSTSKLVWTPLFNGRDLTNFYTYLGTVAEIGRTVKKDSQSYGKNNDPEGVFNVRDGVLRISGKVFGGFVTEKEYENYHLKVEYRWGDKTWPPRRMMARDSGIMMHCVWSEDEFRGWPHSFVECQMIEGGTGDLILVGDGTQKFSVESERRDGQIYFNPGATPITQARGRFNWFAHDPAWKDVKDFRGKQDVERPLGEWNTLECICERDKITAILNGKVVNVGNYTGRVKGNIIIPSQGAEIFLRKIEIKLLSPTNAGTR